MKVIARFVRRNVVGLVALFVALSGTAYAANQIGAQDIARNAIRTSHIKQGQVKVGDLSSGVKKELGAAAEQLQVIKVEGAPLILAPGQFDGAPVAQCPPGYVVVGTGFFGGVAEPGFVLGFGTFVGGFFANDSGIVTESNVQALCGKNSGSGATASNAAALRRFEREVAAAEAARP